MSNFEARLARVADRVRELPEGGDYAQELYSLLSDLSDYLTSRQTQAYAKYQEAFHAWIAFQDSSVEAEQERIKSEAERERTRIIRLLVASPQWHGGYQELVELLG